MFALTIKSEDHPPPTLLIISPVLISTSFAHPSTAHSINFAATSPFKGKTQNGMDSRAGGGIQGGVGSFSQKYQWLYNSITGLAERVRRERRGNILPGVAPFSPSFLPPNTSTLLSEMNKSLCLSDSEDVIIKAACKGPPSIPIQLFDPPIRSSLWSIMNDGWEFLLRYSCSTTVCSLPPLQGVV